MSLVDSFRSIDMELLRDAGLSLVVLAGGAGAAYVIPNHLVPPESASVHLMEDLSKPACETPAQSEELSLKDIG